jgi:hypothetical protein
MSRYTLHGCSTLAAAAAWALCACHGGSSAPATDEPVPTYQFVQGEAEPDAQVSGQLMREGKCFYLVAPPNSRHWVKFPGGVSRFDSEKQAVRVGDTTIRLGQWIVANGAERTDSSPAGCQGDVVYLGTLIHLGAPGHETAPKPGPSATQGGT